MQLYDPQLLRLLSFLTRHQAWLLPKDIATSFRIDDATISSRTIQRWFAFLREHGGFVYYPYPKSNLLGLQEVLVRVRGLRNPAILGILPFAASFNVEVGLTDGRPFATQAYWVPGPALREFEEYWESARDLGLLEGVDMLRSKNTHVIYSPFDRTITADGFVRIDEPVDNAYFAALIRRNLREKFEVRLSDRYRDSPLVIPIVIEHIWRHYSSQHIWRAIQAAGDEHLMKYGRGVLKKAYERPGSALRLVQQQWAALVEHFDEVFLQPRVLFDWPSLRNGTFASFLIRTDTERMVEAAVRASERSLFTALNPGVGPEGMCHVRCFVPNDQFLHVLRVVDEFHRGREPPAIAIQDREATVKLFQPSFCKVDWRLFDPGTLAWQFDGDRYLEHLKDISPAAS